MGARIPVFLQGNHPIRKGSWKVIARIYNVGPTIPLREVIVGQVWTVLKSHRIDFSHWWWCF
jgi:hypothetical protein